MKKLKKFFRKKKREHNLMKEVKNPDWDYGYIYSLLGTKLENVLDYAQNDSVCEIEDWRIDRLKTCIALCKKLSDKVPYYPKHINKNNIRRFVREEDLRFYDFENNEFSYQWLYDTKAKHLLFELLKTYIGYWWD